MDLHEIGIRLWSGEMHKLTEKLYQGARPEGKLPEAITAVVCLMDHAEMRHIMVYEECFESRPKVPCYVHLPTLDGMKHEGWLLRAIETVEFLIKQGFTVLVHCRGGISRSAAVCAGVIMRSEHIKRDAALEKIAKINPKIDPAPCYLIELKSIQ